MDRTQPPLTITVLQYYRRCHRAYDPLLCQITLLLSMAAVRRSQGFIRYALSVQYHGSSFLGFSYQGTKGEDCIFPDGTDMRGFQSIEGRLRHALGSLVGEDNFENVQVSSRTDRGVHAIRNTLHVDLRQRKKRDKKQWDPNNIVNGLNFHLVRQQSSGKKRTRGQPQVHGFLASQRHSPPHELRVLGAKEAPMFMENIFYNVSDDDQPPLIDWNARFSATQRSYVYRILHHSSSNQENYGIPFEWDRSWLLRDSNPLDVSAMRKAALLLTGTHDFSSFRGNNCQRASPVVTMKQIAIHSQPLDPLGMTNMGETLGLENISKSSSLVTIGITGDSFLYRQVRNMVGCVVAVGRGKMKPDNVQQILAERDRRIAPAMAPAHGLFLIDVQHGDFVI